MDARELKNLQEAYHSVYCEGFIPLNPSKMRQKMGQRERQITEPFSGRFGLADHYDYYDIILLHLLDEGYAETPEAAEVMMVNMGEDWRESIIQEAVGDDFNAGEHPDIEGQSDFKKKVDEVIKQRRREREARAARAAAGKTQNVNSNVYNNRRKQKVKDIYNKARQAASKAYNTSPKDAVNAARAAKANTSQAYQNIKDTIKNKARQAASKAYNTSPKDAVNAARQAASKAYNTSPKDAVNAARAAKAKNAKSLVNTAANVSTGAKALRVAGRVAGPAAAALDVASERSKGSGWLRSLAKGAVTAVGGAAGGTLGSAAGPVGTVVGAAGGATAASKAFDVAAGKNAVERAADRVKNRQRQAGGALVGTGGKTTFDTKKNTITSGGKTAQLGKTSVVTHPKTGKQEVGYLAYKDGKAVYKRADKPGTSSSNLKGVIERIGRTINPNAYKANDAKLAAQKLNTAKQSDAARNRALGVRN